VDGGDRAAQVAALEAALAHHRAGRIDEAAAIYRRVLVAEPRNADALHLLGVAAYQRRDYDTAIEMIGRAIAIDRRNPAFYGNLGVALLDRGRAAEAEATFRRALRLRPDDAGTLSNLGLALMDLGRGDAAIAAMKRAVARDPAYAEGWSNLGLALQTAGRLSAAEAACRRSLGLAPGDADTRINLANALKDQGRVGEAMACYERACSLAPDSVLAVANRAFCGHYDPACDGARLHRLAGAYGRLQRRLLGPAKADHANPAEPDRCLRVGYVSPDLGAHSVARFLEPLLAHHDPATVTVHCYSDVKRPDATTARLRALAPAWADISTLTDAEIAARIVDDRMDILVDLAGHTRGNRLGVFARRPAPVQVTWLGYPGTTGLDSMDYRFTDAIADPPGAADREHTERLVRLPRGFLCFARPAEAPDVGPPPSLGAGRVTFGSFNHLAKLTDEVVATWARILVAVPGSRLVLKSLFLGDEGVRERTLARFAAHGIAAERLDPQGWIVERAGHLALYGAVDIALDTFPYNGTTTTCEALWMGVPVVTLAGDRHAARVGMSLLHTVGCEDLVAESLEGYVALATGLAGDPGRLAALREELRARMAASPLCDGDAFARVVEGAYRRMWERWCQGRREGGATARGG